MTDPWRQQEADLATARASAQWRSAVAYLQDYLTPPMPAQIRAAIQTADWPAAYHMGWGMSVRNALRKAGFGEADFGIRNLDNIYVSLVEEAVAMPCPHPEFEAVVDVYRAEAPPVDETLSQFEAAIQIHCKVCRRQMVFKDVQGARVLRVRLDPCPVSISPH